MRQNLYRDDGSIKKESIAQIVNAQNFGRIKKLFDDAVAKGAKIAVGGTLEEADRTIHPTLLTDVTPDMLIMQEEIFGPVVPVLTYRNIDDVIAYISSRPKPLALYIYSNSQNNIEKVLSRTSSGGVTINGFFSHYLENQLPFGGVNQSGMGSYHGVFRSGRSLTSAPSTYRRIDRRKRAGKYILPLWLLSGHDLCRIWRRCVIVKDLTASGQPWRRCRRPLGWNSAPVPGTAPRNGRRR